MNDDWKHLDWHFTDEARDSGRSQAAHINALESPTIRGRCDGCEARLDQRDGAAGECISCGTKLPPALHRLLKGINK